MSFKLLKKQSEDKSRLDKLVTSLEQKEKGGAYEQEEGFWSLTRDKLGNGSAIIRFLSVSKGDEDLTIPVVEKYSHGFRGKTGLWYIENSLTTLGESDPVNYNLAA